jgi:hypothetical protein
MRTTVVTLAVVATLFVGWIRSEFALNDLRREVLAQGASIGRLQGDLDALSKDLGVQRASLQACELRQETPTGQVAASTISREDEPLDATELRTLRAGLGMLERARSSESSRFVNIARTIETDPKRAIEDLRQFITESDAKGKDRSFATIRASLDLLNSKSVDPVDAERELRRFYEDGSDFLRARVAGMLAKKGDPSLVKDLLPELSTKLSSPDRDVRIETLISMAQTESSLASPYLIDLAMRDSELRVRREATLALGMTGGEQAVAVLSSRLLGDESPATVRDAAVRSLEKLGQ